MTDSTGESLRKLITTETDVRTRALLIEAARTADRLDDLDAVIAENGVADLKSLGEARQQAGALKAILAQLGVPKVEAVVEKQRSTVDELRARRAARTPEGEAEATGTSSA